MTPSTNTVRQLLAALGASLAVLVAAGSVKALPDGYQPQASNAGPDLVERYVARHRAHEERAYHASRTGLPDSVAAALERQPAAEPPVIPYLSHGIGIEDGYSPALVREQPDGFQPQLRGVDSAPVADSGFDWETTGFVGGGILAAMLLALASTVALRERRGLSGA
jgi:hypothetical protein